MYSVVIPTMWKYPKFVEFLNDLLEFADVGEVLLINNNIDDMPPLPISHPKLRTFTYGINIGVNPAWNLGVAESKYDKICIANDDVVFDQKMFRRVDTVLGPDSGVVGICPGIKDFDQPPFETGLCQIVPWSGQHTYGFGCLMFVHKSWWIPIPDGLKIYYGDNWIFDTCLARGRVNYLITDVFFYTPFATTTGQITDVDAIHQVEQPIYEYAFAEFRASVQQTTT